MTRSIRSRASFRLLSSAGRRLQGEYLWMRFVDASRADVGETQYAFAVGRSIGNAVLRNRIRRRLRALFEARAATLPPGLYLIGVRDAAAATVAFDRLGADLDTVVDQLAKS